jgi:hypothetical protein
LSDDDYIAGERTPGGSMIIEPGMQPRQDVKPTPFLEEIEAHLERHIGQCKTVLHEVISDRIHLDVLTFPPEGDRDFWYFVTAGMSDLPMTLGTPEDEREFGRAELVIGLSRDWGERLVKQPIDKSVYAPIGFLKWLARYPHDGGTYLASGHTVPTSPDVAKLGEAGELSAALLIPPITWPDEAIAFTLSNGDRLNFYGVLLLHEEELEMKLNQGTDALLEKLEVNGVTEVLDILRPSATRRKRFLGLF